LWNAARFIDGYANEKDKFKAENVHDKWIYDEFSKTKKQINKNISDYRLDFAVNEIYEFFWNKFCDVYIEQCKKSRGNIKFKTTPKRNSSVSASICSIYY
jgi:Valyl-tRNA synthetase